LPVDLVADQAFRRSTAHVEAIRQRFRSREATVGVVGLGYVGLPLALAGVAAGFRTIGFDTDPHKIEALNAGRSYICQVPDESLVDITSSGRFRATTNFALMEETDAILICVPTPLTRHREPNLTYVINTTQMIAQHLQSGQLVVLESTTYPGTTQEVVKPILEKNGWKSGYDFFLAYSPERADPGNERFSTKAIPKVVGADGDEALALACELYGAVIDRVVPVRSMQVAEAVKLTENVFRSVNIALVNELKIVFEELGVNIFEVLEAAETKPFGFMPFYPGPGLGGHCIPIDPFYLTWKAREVGMHTRFIELAGEINTAMPSHVVERTARILDMRFKKGLNGARLLVCGIAYKKNVDDTRESPALTIIELLEGRGASVDFYDPFVPVVPATREHPSLEGRRGILPQPEKLRSYDAALIIADHDGVDYAALVENSRLVIDTRNATRQISCHRDRIVLA
jgi:UDP-N-acetyl-D-glucosamine dehydrogenase